MNSVAFKAKANTPWINPASQARRSTNRTTRPKPITPAILSTIRAGLSSIIEVPYTTLNEWMIGVDRKAIHIAAFDGRALAAVPVERALSAQT